MVATSVADISFAMFIYPFTFDARTFSSRVATVERAVWSAKSNDLPLWSALPIRTDGMLAHVADYLNPRVAEKVPTARFWKLRDEARTSRDGLWADLPWELTSARLENGRGPIQFSLEAVELALFATGVGFLIVSARPEQSDFDIWLDFLHDFRFAGGSGARQRKVRVRALARRGPVDQQPIFPAPAQPYAELTEDGAGRFSAIIRALLQAGDERDDHSSPWWEDVFVRGQLLPFVGVWVDGMAATGLPPAVYRLRNVFHPDEGSRPSSPELQLDENPALLPYADRQWFVFSLDVAAFVAFDAPTDGSQGQFYRGQLKSHLRREYFLIFLLVLHQRFVLMSLLDRVAWAWSDGSDVAREDAFLSIREDLLTFTARGYFAQVSQRAHPHRYYCRWQDTFQLDRLYVEVNDEIREMYGIMEMRRTKRLQQLEEEEARRLRELEKNAQVREVASQRRAQAIATIVGVLTIFLGGPAVALSYVSATGAVSRAEGVWWAIGGAAGGAAVAMIVFLLGWLQTHFSKNAASSDQS